MPRVDVIIPVYNTPTDYVRQALRSVVGQTLQDWRAVVVNDGSTPENSAALEALLDNLADPRIVYIKTENRGPTAARNTGIESSDSPFIAFLDADDLCHAHRLQTQVDALTANPDVDLVHGFTDLLHDNDHAGIRRAEPHDVGLNSIDNQTACLHLLRKNYISVNTVTVRRSAGEAVGFFDPAFFSIEDKEMWCRWLIEGRRFLHQPVTLGVYRVHTTNSSKNAERMREGRMRLIGKIDALLARGGSPWLSQHWPELRRQMVRHANQEAAETYLESGSARLALRHAAPWRSGVSAHSLWLMAASVAASVGLHLPV